MAIVVHLVANFVSFVAVLLIVFNAKLAIMLLLVSAAIAKLVRLAV